MLFQTGFTEIVSTMDSHEFRRNAHRVVDWIADYLENIESYPVKSQVKPGEISDQLPSNPPLTGESFEAIMADFEKIIMPGITHWQSPSFFAYFPANSSYPSILGEMLTATLATQCMIWQTSPAAAELEEQVMEWLKKMLHLPSGWSGVIQDTASTATLCALLTAREKVSDYNINKTGLKDHSFVVYCSEQTHSSIEKDVKIAGIGSENLRLISVDENYAMRPELLKAAIEKDIREGFVPLCVVATIGTTGTTAIDPVDAIAEICETFDIWLHVDAAFAGNALVLEELSWMGKGLERADSFVFNPHKWMFTNFDCSAYFVADSEALVRTFEILPEYLKTKEHQPVKNYRDWGVPLGRRFRALKLWFVIRSYGVNGIRERFREQLRLAESLEKQIRAHKNFEMLAPRPLVLLCFRFHPGAISDESALNSLNEQLVDQLNASGKMYLTHTKLNDKYTIRLHVGQTNTTSEQIEKAWKLIQQTAESLI